MSKEKILLIAVIALWTLLLVCVFGLSFISDAFVVVGIYSGITAMIGVIVLLDWRAGKEPNLIVIGAAMMLFGIVLSTYIEIQIYITRTLSSLYTISGLAILAKGVKDWAAKKIAKARQSNKRLSKKLYIGIGMIVCGYSAIFVLYSIDPMLMTFGYIAVFAGFILLCLGLPKKQEKAVACSYTDLNPVKNAGSSASVHVERCDYCNKIIAGQKDIFVVDGRKLCADCKAVREQELKNQHVICSVCGVDLPAENMHVIDGALLCHSCFLKKCSVFDSYVQESITPMLEEATRSLRKQIIATIEAKPAYQYQLGSLLWEDAGRCFPGSGRQWDGAWFNLDLKTGALSAEVSTYPNQFGASYQDTIVLTAGEFNRIAKQFNMCWELQAFETSDDWKSLFDDRLKKAVSDACQILQKQEEERRKEEAQRNAVAIPADYQKQSPNMGITAIAIALDQRYSSCSVKVSLENGAYKLVYSRMSHMSADTGSYPHVLTAAEAVWLEAQVESTIKNPDQSTWQSLPGGDLMDVTIQRNKGRDVSVKRALPIKKYTELLNVLQKLAQYGSVSG